MWNTYWSNYDPNTIYTSSAAVPAPTTQTLNWNTHCPLYGKIGFTAISQCNAFGAGLGYGNRGIFPVTALTKRHGYMRGHGNGGGEAGQRVWFCDANNQIVEMTVLDAKVRYSYNPTRDYCIVLFSADLPSDRIPPLLVGSYPRPHQAVCFTTHQMGRIDANIPPFSFDDRSKPRFNDVAIGIDGDSGSPYLQVTTDGRLVFVGGATTTGPCPQMQADMDFLCTNQVPPLDIHSYQMTYATGWPR